LFPSPLREGERRGGGREAGEGGKEEKIERGHSHSVIDPIYFYRLL
jgi:hypothetical protein